jgi:hypothetical protein
MTTMNGHDILTDTHDETTYRERATALLDEIAAQARTALREAGICINVFFIVPPSGDAILTLGAVATREDWQEIKSAASSIVRRSIGLEPSRCREIICARTDGDEPGS